MDFQQVVARRRMVRDYDPDRAVPTDVRDRLLYNAQRAPSAGFSQGTAYVVLEDLADRDRFWAATAGARPPNAWLTRMRRAPLLIVCWCSEQIYRERYAASDKVHADPFATPWWYVDAGMGVLLMLQTAVDAELGACLFGIPRQRVDAVRALLGVPAQWRPVGVVAVGYPAGSDPAAHRSPRTRRPQTEVVHMGHWGSGPTAPRT